ncbi:MAG: LysM domain-containing protein [Cardiobacteriaceae bacterium]|nr:LysM domain-containing protein [Cardiobacteriaceae bacterium]
MTNSWKILGVAVALAVTGCSSPKDPFSIKYERPAELCLAGGAVDNAHFPSEEAVFHEQHPMQYVVKKGDTLWDISRRFLTKPWHWKRIWQANPKIKNPHLIYPGDVLTVVNVNGEKRVTIGEPSVHHGIVDTGKRTKDGRPIERYVAEKSGKMTTLDLTVEPISIKGRIIQSHASKNRIVKPAQSENLPFVYGDGIDYLTLSQQEEVFAQGLGVPEFGSLYGIYRKSNTYFDLDQQKINKDIEPMAVEMQYVATAGVINTDAGSGATRLKLLEVAQTLREGDVLLPLADPEVKIQNYFPQLPTNQCSQGYFLANTSDQTLMGKEYDTMVVSFGRDNGARVGDIWKIVRQTPSRMVNGQVVTAPAKDIGYVMIIEVLDNVSMALVMESTQNIYLTDALVRP